MQCQDDLIATLAVIPLTLTDIKCVARLLVSVVLSLVSALTTSYVQDVYLLQFGLICLSAVSLCIWIQSDISWPFVEGFCSFNL